MTCNACQRCRSLLSHKHYSLCCTVSMSRSLTSIADPTFAGSAKTLSRISKAYSLTDLHSLGKKRTRSSETSFDKHTTASKNKLKPAKKDASRLNKRSGLSRIVQNIEQDRNSDKKFSQAYKEREKVVMNQTSTTASKRRDTAVLSGKRSRLPQVSQFETSNTGRRDAPSAGRREAPSAGRRDAPSAGRREAPSAGRREAPSAGRRDAPSAGRRNAPSAGRKDAPSAGRREASNAVKRETPNDGKTNVSNSEKGDTGRANLTSDQKNKIEEVSPKTLSRAVNKAAPPRGFASVVQRASSLSRTVGTKKPVDDMKLNKKYANCVCEPCKLQIHEKLKRGYSKYKSLEKMKPCEKCKRLVIDFDFYTICTDCAKSSGICAKCAAGSTAMSGARFVEVVRSGVEENMLNMTDKQLKQFAEKHAKIGTVEVKISKIEDEGRKSADGAVVSAGGRRSTRRQTSSPDTLVSRQSPDRISTKLITPEVAVPSHSKKKACGVSGLARSMTSSSSPLAPSEAGSEVEIHVGSEPESSCSTSDDRGSAGHISAVEIRKIPRVSVEGAKKEGSTVTRSRHSSSEIIRQIRSLTNINSVSPTRADLIIQEIRSLTDLTFGGEAGDSPRKCMTPSSSEKSIVYDNDIQPKIRTPTRLPPLAAPENSSDQQSCSQPNDSIESHDVDSIESRKHDPSASLDPTLISNRNLEKHSEAADDSENDHSETIPHAANKSEDSASGIFADETPVDAQSGECTVMSLPQKQEIVQLAEANLRPPSEGSETSKMTTPEARTPEPITPEACTPEAKTPVPITPEPVTPEPQTPEPSESKLSEEPFVREIKTIASVTPTLESLSPEALNLEANTLEALTPDTNAPKAPEAPEALTPEATTPEALTLKATTPEALTLEDKTTDVPYVETTIQEDLVSRDKTPRALTPEDKTPRALTPEALTAEAKTPEALTAEAKSPEALTPEAKSPEAQTPEAKTPEGLTPEAKTPESLTAEAKTPEALTPEVVLAPQLSMKSPEIGTTRSVSPQYPNNHIQDLGDTPGPFNSNDPDKFLTAPPIQQEEHDRQAVVSREKSLSDDLHHSTVENVRYNSPAGISTELLSSPRNEESSLGDDFLSGNLPDIPSWSMLPKTTYALQQMEKLARENEANYDYDSYDYDDDEFEEDTETSDRGRHTVGQSMEDFTAFHQNNQFQIVEVHQDDSDSYDRGDYGIYECHQHLGGLIRRRLEDIPEEGTISKETTCTNFYTLESELTAGTELGAELGDELDDSEDELDEPGDKEPGAEDDTEQRETDHVTSGVDHVTSGVDHVTSGVDHVTSGVDHVTSGVDHVTSGVDHVTSGVDHVTSGVDHVTSSVDHVTSGDQVLSLVDLIDPPMEEEETKGPDDAVQEVHIVSTADQRDKELREESHSLEENYRQRRTEGELYLSNSATALQQNDIFIEDADFSEMS